MVDRLTDAGGPQEGIRAFIDPDAMTALAYVLTGSRDDAQDVVQTVLVRLVSADMRSVLDLRAYCRRAVVNECSTLRRSRSRSARRFEQLRDEWLRRHATQPDAYGRLEVMEALRHLPARQRSAVVLRYYLDWDDQAIAETLGCAPATVRSLLSRALRRLQSTLRDTDDEQEQQRELDT